MILVSDTLDELNHAQIAGLLTACGIAIREQSALSTALRELGFHVPGFNDQDCFLLEESADLIDDNDLVQLAILCAQKLGIIAHKQKKSTPKTLGYIARETWELFEFGWLQASLLTKEHQEQVYHARNTQSCVRLLEVALYDSASRGNTTDKVQALNYFRESFQPPQTPSDTPLLGEHILSGFVALCSVCLICLGGMFAAKVSCDGNASNFCGDVNTITSQVTSYFIDNKK